MRGDEIAFVSFRPERDRFKGFLSLEAAIRNEDDPEVLLRRATTIYEEAIKMLRLKVRKIRETRTLAHPLAARKVWELGESIFVLRDGLEALSLRLDGFYDHLVRDLGVKRKWLEKVIILRRYVPKKALIAPSLSWGRCEKGTRRVAQRLAEGLPPD